MSEEEKSFLVPINSKDIFWVVFPSVEETERDGTVVRLNWGFDWDSNYILMQKDMAVMLRDSLNEILDTK